MHILFSVLWAVMSIAITRLQINLREAAVELEPLLNNLQETPPPESRREETSVILIWGNDRRGIHTLTSNIQSRSMTSTHHRTPSDYESHHIRQVQTDTLARASTFRDEDGYAGMEESEPVTYIHPSQNIAVTRSTIRVMPMGPRGLVTMNKGFSIATDHVHSGSFHKDHDSVV
ncbi:hypothetical protein CPB86DRAFT_593273 [Serendipita vermifera]|nr:hypothetical protein CPB86DRAFT_593273 [Serendipita vermifera]